MAALIWTGSAMATGSRLRSCELKRDMRQRAGGCRAQSNAEQNVEAEDQDLRGRCRCDSCSNGSGAIECWPRRSFQLIGRFRNARSASGQEIRESKAER